MSSPYFADPLWECLVYWHSVSVLERKICCTRGILLSWGGGRVIWGVGRLEKHAGILVHTEGCLSLEGVKTLLKGVKRQTFWPNPESLFNKLLMCLNCSVFLYPLFALALIRFLRAWTFRSYFTIAMNIISCMLCIGLMSLPKRLEECVNLLRCLMNSFLRPWALSFDPLTSRELLFGWTFSRLSNLPWSPVEACVCWLITLHVMFWANSSSQPLVE